MKINWMEAKADYIADTRLSYADIAKKYGISLTKLSERASREGWTTLRRKALIRGEQKVIEAISDKIASDKERLMKQARFVAGKGLAGIARINPKTARESKELWEAGATIQAKILGLDKPQVNVQNNTQVVIGWDKFIAMMEERKKDRET